MQIMCQRLTPSINHLLYFYISAQNAKHENLQLNVILNGESDFME